MISLFVMYSADRSVALGHALSCLRDMEFYGDCQRTLVVDGKADSVPHDWEAVQVPRLGGRFCWARMWDAGVLTAAHPIVCYLDSDRLLPPNYLRLVYESVAEDNFVYTSRHFMMLRELPVVDCKRLLSAIDRSGALLEDEFVGSVMFEPRFGEPVHGPGKNVMSGSTAFLRETYLKIGGVDPWYCGHGAFADTDFHLQAARAGCRFVDLGVPELHYPHAKLEGGAALDEQAMQLLALDNFVYYCVKWSIPQARAEDLAYRSGVARARHYVASRFKQLRQTPGDFVEQKLLVG